ncbi:hypothetical protein LX36DRAFT_417085 [Colletotrichum falcatum]|nr:hypothetical protein LX36DRAFT_417085 [Colletotrichum falcatum]
MAPVREPDFLHRTDHSREEEHPQLYTSSRYNVNAEQPSADLFGYMSMSPTWWMTQHRLIEDEGWALPGQGQCRLSFVIDMVGSKKPQNPSRSRPKPVLTTPDSRFARKLPSFIDFCSVRHGGRSNRTGIRHCRAHHYGHEDHRAQLQLHFRYPIRAHHPEIVPPRSLCADGRASAK